MPCHWPTPPLFTASFELSDSTVKGEGELKILSRLLHSSAGPRTNTSGRGGGSSGGEGGRQQQAQQQQGQPREETHLVLGSDSDLLLMALVAGQVRMPPANRPLPGTCPADCLPMQLGLAQPRHWPD